MVGTSLRRANAISQDLHQVCGFFRRLGIVGEPHPRPLSESERGRGWREGENELSMKLPFHQDATPKIFENARFLKKVQTDAEAYLWKRLRNRKLH